ncbi:amidohydrolase [Dactylosporangium vinaceum]|uniref:Amidohydrolase family protein n=1 Tax=Dactylosporangium vinaceum TaxID=53362 RepID=A0ABV5MRA9_9ACTN|nr:amidohydrolase family protein [Dactylosporangium vinaceum]UAC00494.1 amidohydrolase [Dactylosporangium vinaceum]
MASIDELLKNTGFTTADRGKVTFLPDPPRQERKYTFISVDDHIVEPPDAFAGRMPAKYAEQAPHVVERDGSHVWVYDGQEFPNVGFNAVVGRPVDEYGMEPCRFDDMRRGSWDIHERIRDMDLSGVYASLCFPSFLPGFAGQRLQLSTKDAELALAATRAWNDWNIEAWSGAYPDRMIPCQLPYFLDPQVGAQEIYRNAERGFKAVTFSEAPHMLGLPSLHTGHWDPIMRACAETGTVVNLHIGSSGTSPSTAPDAPPDVVGVLFFGYSMFSAVDWLYSRIPVRFPDIKIVLSEGGIGWVPGLVDRLNHMLSYHAMYGTWKGIDRTPAEVLLRNFYFCAVEDPSSFALRDVIGVEHILLEQDYPHCDSTWPHTQRTIEEEIGGLPAADVRKMTWENASVLYRHPVPAAVQQDPDAY